MIFTTLLPLVSLGSGFSLHNSSWTRHSNCSCASLDDWMDACSAIMPARYQAWCLETSSYIIGCNAMELQQGCAAEKQVSHEEAAVSVAGDLETTQAPFVGASAWKGDKGTDNSTDPNHGDGIHCFRKCECYDASDLRWHKIDVPCVAACLNRTAITGAAGRLPSMDSLSDQTQQILLRDCTTDGEVLSGEDCLGRNLRMLQSYQNVSESAARYIEEHSWMRDTGYAFNVGAGVYINTLDQMFRANKFELMKLVARSDKQEVLNLIRYLTGGNCGCEKVNGHIIGCERQSSANHNYRCLFSCPPVSAERDSPRCRSNLNSLWKLRAIARSAQQCIFRVGS